MDGRLAYFRGSNPYLWAQCLHAALLLEGVFPSLPFVGWLAVSATLFLGMAFGHRLSTQGAPTKYTTFANPFLAVGLAFVPFTALVWFSRLVHAA